MPSNSIHKNFDYNNNLILPPTDQIINDLYQNHSQKQEQDLEKHSWLRKGHPLGEPVKIDWKLGALLLGDGHITGTPNEGYTTEKSTSYFRQFTQHLLDEYKADKENYAFLAPYASDLEKFYSSMEHSNSIAKMITQASDEGMHKNDTERDELLDVYAEKMQLHFREKKEGWIPCGWVTKNGDSHAMMAHIDMKKGQVTIVNTGGGILENHPAIQVASKDALTGEIKDELRVQQFVTYTDVDKRRMNDKALFRFFLELQARPSWDGQLDFGPDHIYKPLKKYLKGKEQNALSPFDHPEAYKKPQHSGTCAIKSVTASLYYTLTKNFHGNEKANGKKAARCYKKIHYLWQTQALVGLAKLVDNQITAAQRLLLEDLMDDMSRSGEKLYKKQLLTDNDLLELHCTIEDLKGRLSSINTAAEEMEPSQPGVSGFVQHLPNITGLYPSKELFLYATDLSNIVPGLKGSETKSKLADTPVDKLIKTFSFELPKIKHQGMPDQQIQAVLDLFKIIDTVDFKESYHQLNEVSKTAVTQILLNYLGSFIGDLPIPSKTEASYWSTLPQNEVVGVMEKVTALMNLLVKVPASLDHKTHLYPISKKSHTPDLTVMHYALLAITDQLARTLPETKLDDFTPNYYELILEMRSPHFVIKDRLLQKTLDKVVHYFDPGLTLETLVEKEGKSTVKEKINGLFAYKDLTSVRDHAYFGSYYLNEDKLSAGDPLTKYFGRLLQEIQNDPNKVKKLYQRGKLPLNHPTAMRPLSPADSKIEHLAALMGDQDDENSLIPKSVRLLQHATLLCSVLHYDPGFNPTSFLYPHATFKLGTYKLDVKRPEYRLEVIPVNTRHATIDDVFDENLKPYTGSTLVGDLKERIKQNELITRQSVHFDQGLDISRELEMIGVDPSDEVARTTAFIRKHPNLLKEKAVQGALEIHLFRFGRLDSQLVDEPAIALELGSEIHHALHHYMQMEDIETCLFLAKLGQDLKVYAEQAGIKLPMTDFRSVIYTEIIPHYQEDNYVKLQCFKTLASFYENISPEQAIGNPELQRQIVHDIAGQYMLRVMHKDIVSDPMVRAVELKMQPLIEETFKNPVMKDDSLNTLVNLIYPTSEEHTWTGAFPIFENELFLVDLNEWTVTNKEGGTLSYLPQKILNDDTFRKIHKGPIETCEKKSDGKTYLINAGLPNELFIREEPFFLEFQKKIDGVDYHYENMPELLRYDMPTMIDSTDHSWVRFGSDPELVVFNNAGKRVLVAKLERTPTYVSHYKIQKIHKCGYDGKAIEDLVWIPFNNSPASIQRLRKFEQDTKYIECWGKILNEHGEKTSALTEVKLPRLGLSFKTKRQDGKELLFCDQHPGYYLAENPNIQALSKTPLFLTLQNSSGERKILVPKVPLKVNFQADPFDTIIAQTISSGFSWLEYELKHGELSSSHLQSQLYHLQLSLARRDFHNAAKQLKMLTPLDRFKDDKEEGVSERTMVKEIINALQKDKHPAARALLLKLAMLSHYNDLKYPLPINAKKEEALFTPEQLAETYLDYYSNATNTPAIKLTEKEEKEILNRVFLYLDEMINKARKTKKRTDIQAAELQAKKLEKYLGERRKYLNSGTTKLGARTFCVPQAPKSPESITSYDLLFCFGKYQTNGGFQLPSFLIHDDTFFKDHFFSLYRIALEGTEHEKEKFKKIIDCSDSVNSEYYNILKKVLNNPAKYPTLAKLESLELIKNKDKKDVFLYYRAEDQQKKVLSELLPSKNIFARIWKKVKVILRAIVSMQIGKFSIGTRAYEIFIHRFKARYKKSPDRKNSHKIIPINCDGKALHDADKAFDSYFQNLTDQYFVAETVPVTESKDKLPEHYDDKNIAVKLKEENEKLAAFYENRAKTEKKYTLAHGVLLSDLQKELEEKVCHLTTTLKTQKTALLWQLNDIPEQVQKRSLKQVHQVGFHHRLTWEDLRDITLKGDLQTFTEKTHLGEIEAKRLLVGVSDYLIKSSRLDQMRTTLSKIKKYEKVSDKKNAEIYLQNIPKTMTACRAYQPDTTNLSNQWFEAANHYLYRDIQLQKIKEFSDTAHDQIQGEAPTGFGKTKNIIPNLNYIKSQEGKLVVNTWPASLEMQNAVDSREQMALSFGKNGDRFNFDRASAFTTESLAHLYNEILLDKENGTPINIRSEALRSLELHTLLFLKQAKHKQGNMKELKVQISYLIKILRLVRTEGWTTIDEEHINLDPMDKLIYTLGDPVILSSEEIDQFEYLFRLLEEDEFDRLFHISDNQQSQITEAQFSKEIAPKLALAFSNNFKIPPENINDYLRFVLSKSDNIPAWLEKHPDRAMIALVKGLLSQVLKTSLKGNVDEHFGLSKLHLKKNEYAIPYSSANTPKETKQSPSQFKNPHETMTKTYLTYLHKGLAREQTGKLIEFLKVQSIQESKEGIPLENTQANQFFESIAPQSKKLLHTLKEDDIDALHSDLAKNRKVIFYYIRNIVVPQLKIYPNSLISTVHNFRTQFPSSLSLSATPQDKTTHGLDTHFVPMKDTSGQVTHLLLTKCNDPKSLHEIGSVKPAEALEESLNIISKNPRIHATIDIGANFKGLNNAEVAEKIRKQFEKNDEIQAILYFDEKEALFKVMDIATGQTHDPRESNIEPEQTQTFYDQSRCFGSDLTQAIDAIGLLMTGKNTTKASAGQGAGRMRLWHNGQSVEIGYPSTIKKDILENDRPDIKKLLVYWLANDVKAAENKNYQSQLQQMDNEIRRALLDKILGLKISKKPNQNLKEPDVDKAISLTSEWDSEFFSNESHNPWNMYAPIPQDKDSIEILKKQQSSCLKKAKNLAKLNSRERKHISNRLKDYSKMWGEMILPEKVKDYSSDLGMECEVLQEVETETEVEIQAHIKEDIQERKPISWPKDLNLFDQGWEKPAKQNVALKKFIKRLTGWTPERPAAKVLTGVAIGAAIGIVAATALAIAGIAWPIIAAVGGTLALAGLAFGLFAFLSNRHVTKGNPIYRVKDIMALHLPSRVSKASAIFSPNLLVSNNFYVQQTQQVAETPQKPLNVEQKPVFTLLIIMDDKDNGKQDVKAMVIDQNDSPFFHTKLKEDNLSTDEKSASKRNRKVGLFDISNEMFTIQGKNPFKKEDLNNPDLLRLIAEAKFLNGEINYTEREMENLGPHIEEVAKKVGYGPLQKLFENHILQYHPLNRCFLKNQKHPKPIAQVLGLA